MNSAIPARQLRRRLAANPTLVKIREPEFCSGRVSFFAVLFLVFFHASGPPHRWLKGKIQFRVAPPEANLLSSSPIREP
jgi:hypothetical protein